MKDGMNKRLSQILKIYIMKILWDVFIQMDRLMKHQRPNIVVMEMTTEKCMIIDVACRVKNNLIRTRNKKLDNYFELRPVVLEIK